MFITYFNQTQIGLLLAAGICLFLSTFFHLRDREKWMMVFLVITALLVNFFAASLDPFLNLWDERFHALVAKNLMNHPLKPTLYDDPVVSMAYDRWDRYYIWLHKQPLFLWQIALSFKIFGISEFTLRLPSAFLGAIYVLIGYRSGKLLVNKRTGFITGLFMITSMYFLELIAGRQELEHNDVSFMVYIALSFWALIEYIYSGKKRWILLIGLFSGMAILCKWLAGLVVYPGWFIFILLKGKFGLRKFVPLLLALLTTVIVVIPWQILTLLWYPSEVKMAFETFSLHFLKPLDGHRGDFWYHFNQIGMIYGRSTPFILIPALIVLYIKMNMKRLYLPVLLMILLVYLFFSLASTKMPSFTIIVSVFIFIAIASLIDALLGMTDKIKMPLPLKNALVIMTFVLIVFSRFNIEKIQGMHTLWKPDNMYTRWLTSNKEVFEGLNLPPHTVIFNVKGRHYIEAMFYTGLPAYNFIPSEGQYTDVKRKGRTVAVFRPPDADLPGYLSSDTSVIILTDRLQGWD